MVEFWLVTLSQSALPTREDYISQKPMGPRLVFLLLGLWSSSNLGLLGHPRGCWAHLIEARETWFPARPPFIEAGRPWQGGPGQLGAPTRKGVPCSPVFQLNVGARGRGEAFAAGPEMAPSEQISAVRLCGHRGRARYPGPPTLGLSREGCWVGGLESGWILAQVVQLGAGEVAPVQQLGPVRGKTKSSCLVQEEELEVTQVSSPQFLLPLKRVIIAPANPFQRSMGDLIISLLRIISPFVSMVFKINLNHNPLLILGIVSLVY